MHWYFERDGQRLRWEIRREAGGTGYELVLTPPGSPEVVERIGDGTTLIERTLSFQQSLMDDGWRSPHAPRDPEE